MSGFVGLGRLHVGPRRCLLAALAAGLVAAPAFAVPVVVRGAATVDATVATDGDAQIIRGTLKDDVGRPVPHGRLTVAVIDASGRSVQLPPPRPCAVQGASPRPSGEGYALETDGAGAFCVRTSQLPPAGSLRVVAEGDKALAGAKLDIPFDATHASAVLSWDGAPQSIDLDANRFSTTVVVTSSRGTTQAPVVGATVSLWDGEQKLASAPTDERGKAVFDLPTSVFRTVGKGELVARLQGGAARDLRQAVVRNARVGLTGAPPEDAVVPASGVVLELGVDSSRGAVAHGVIEARVGTETVGAAEVKEGRARVPVTFDVPEAGVLPVTFGFSPSQPGYVAGPALTLRLPVRPPSPWRKLPFVLLGVAVLAVVARGWRRAPRAEAVVAKRRGEPPRLPDIAWKEERGARGLSGTVLDAHEARPLGGARLTVVARDFRGEHVVASTDTGPDGAYELRVEWAPDRFLVAEAPLHARIEKPLPRPGRATVALVLRRRALVDRLLAAVRKAGPPWASVPEPTPAEVARRAEEVRAPEVAAWARRVEDAAFGAPTVDAAREASVAELERELPKTK